MTDTIHYWLATLLPNLVMTHSSPWKITMLLIGKASISMGHLYHGYVSHNQMVVTRYLLSVQGRPGVEICK